MQTAFVTGHTGFKGSWLCLLLHAQGLKVHGYALEPRSDGIFAAARVHQLLQSDTRADLADRGTLHAALGAARPELVFHLAGQALVQEGLDDPLGTLTTNILGTAHLLEAVRAVDSVRAVVVVTTDKVYQPDPAPRSEADRLGGDDPYAASKAASEMVVAAYRDSFFQGARVATARAGNVIGGGDVAPHRLVPDCLRAFQNGQPVRLRQPGARRPWQHVLDPLRGYLALALRLADSPRFASAWNFGPGAEEHLPVEQVARSLASLWGPPAEVELDGGVPGQPLLLDSSRARRELEWAPRWSLPRALESTVAWHRAWLEGRDMREYSLAEVGS